MDREGSPVVDQILLQTPEIQPKVAEDPAPGKSSTSTSPGFSFSTASQDAALDRVLLLARLVGADCLPSGITPRVFPLLVGPSGSGKTAVLRKAAAKIDYPLLVINSGSWIVEGAREGTHTLNLIQRCVRNNNRGMIFVDEIDKCSDPNDRSSWALSVLTELISLLDQDTKLLTAGWSEDDVNKLKAQFMIVGAGAWQVVANAQGKHLGFGASTKGDYHAEMIRQGVIPEELLYRFNLPAIVIQPPTVTDFMLGIRSMHREMEINPPRAVELKALAETAAASKLGMRWLEQYLSGLLIRKPKKIKRRPYTITTPKDPEKAGNKWRDLFVYVCSSAEASVRLYLSYSEQITSQEVLMKRDHDRVKKHNEKQGVEVAPIPSFNKVKHAFGEKSHLTVNLKGYREWLIEGTIQSRNRLEYQKSCLQTILTGLLAVHKHMADFRAKEIKNLSEIHLLGYHVNGENGLDDACTRIKSLLEMSPVD